MFGEVQSALLNPLQGLCRLLVNGQDVLLDCSYFELLLLETILEVLDF